PAERGGESLAVPEEATGDLQIEAAHAFEDDGPVRLDDERGEMPRVDLLGHTQQAALAIEALQDLAEGWARGAPRVHRPILALRPAGAAARACAAPARRPTIWIRCGAPDTRRGWSLRFFSALRGVVASNSSRTPGDDEVELTDEPPGPTESP